MTDSNPGPVEATIEEDGKGGTRVEFGIKGGKTLASISCQPGGTLVIEASDLVIRCGADYAFNRGAFAPMSAKPVARKRGK